MPKSASLTLNTLESGPPKRCCLRTWIKPSELKRRLSGANLLRLLLVRQGSESAGRSDYTNWRPGLTTIKQEVRAGEARYGDDFVCPSWKQFLLPGSTQPKDSGTDLKLHVNEANRGTCRRHKAG